MKKLLGVALLGAVVAAPAKADAPYTLSWNSVCTAGPTSQCASAQLTISATGLVQVRFWNMAGIDGTTANDQGGWRQVGFTGINFGAISNLEVFYPNGSEYEGWSFDATLNPADGQGVLINGNPNVIVDGSVYSGQIQNRAVTSWAGNFNSGYVLFQWQSTPVPNFDPDFVFLTGHIISNTYGSITYSCAQGENCLPPVDPCLDPTAPGCSGGPNETVPEPATMTLLATGLAGMAAARRRRKNA